MTGALNLAKAGIELYPGCIPAAKDDSRPNVLQLNTEGLTTNKISAIEQLA